MIIYRILNKIDGKCYIGQTQKSFDYRYVGGRWWKRANSYLFNAFQKYGPENFEVQILEEKVETAEKLNMLEIEYIKKYNSLAPNGYNLKEGGDNTKAKSAEIFGDLISTVKNKNKTFSIKNPDGIILQFKNLTKFCKEHNLLISQISQVLNGKRNYYKQWTLPSTKLWTRGYISPSGEKILVKEGLFRSFCRQFQLHHGHMADVWAGKCSQHKGWKKYNEQFCA